MAKPTVSFRLSKNLIKKLQVNATERGISKTDIVTEALNNALDNKSKVSNQAFYLQMVVEQLELQNKQLAIIEETLGIKSQQIS